MTKLRADNAVLDPDDDELESFVNLARVAFTASSVPVVDFNPWMFSGAEQLVDWFFNEIGAELKLRPGLGHVGDLFSQYDDLFSGLGWVPIAGAWIERARLANNAFVGFLQKRKKGSREQRSRLNEELSKRTEPIAVIIDDIDRLTTREIREIFKLVRLTANFPNVVYVLAFDRHRVEAALHEDEIPGRAYLEKIVQVEIDLPTLPDEVLQGRVLRGIQDAIDATGVDGPFNANAWQDTFSEIILPLIKTMRDVRRLSLSIYGSIKALGDKVDNGDLIAIDAVRVFMPDVYAKLGSSITGLTSTRSFGIYAQQDAPTLKAQVDAVLSAAPEEQRDVVRAMIRRLFPAGGGRIGGTSYASDFESTWLIGRRVASRDILRLVLERTPNASLNSHMSAEAALDAMGDVATFAGYFEPLESDEVSDVLTALSNLRQSFGDANVVPGLVVSHNLLPRVGAQGRGMVSLDGRFVVGRLTYLLLERWAESPEKVLAAVREALPQIETLRGRHELITSVGHRENAGHKFIAVEAAAKLEAEWREQVRSISAGSLATEAMLLYLLLRVKTEAADDEPPFSVPNEPAVTLSLLRSAVGDVRSSMMGNRAVHHEPRLDWHNLTELYGSEEELKKRIDEARSVANTSDDDLFDLAARYAEGWRPKEF